MKKSSTARLSKTFGVAALALAGAGAQAGTVSWTDWQTGGTSGGVFTGNGTISAGGTAVGVTYANPQGVAFFQSSGGTDYWGNRTSTTSPYTSAQVDNAPTGTDIIGVSAAGWQTITFSQAVRNIYISFVSLNANGYGFLNQDFTLLSYGHPNDGNSCGYWGCGTSAKQVVNVAEGTEYRLVGTGEPHGTIMLTGDFTSLSWRNLNGEFWNGFTIGIDGVAPEPAPVPEPASLALVGLGLAGLRLTRRKQQS